MEELTGFGVKKSLTLPSLANKNFKSLRNENDEPTYIYNDEFMRHFVRQHIKGGRCGSYNQYYRSIISDEIFNFISKELNVIGNVGEIINNYYEYTIKHRKSVEDE